MSDDIEEGERAMAESWRVVVSVIPPKSHGGYDNAIEFREHGWMGDESREAAIDFVVDSLADIGGTLCAVIASGAMHGEGSEFE